MHGCEMCGEGEVKRSAEGTRTTLRRSVRKRWTGSERHAAGMRKRPGCGGAQPTVSMERCAKRAYAVVSGPRRKWLSPRRGRCWGRRSHSLRPGSDSLLGRPGELRSNPTSCPGNRDHAPGFALRPNPEKPNNDPSIAPGRRPLSTRIGRIPGTRSQSVSSQPASPRRYSRQRPRVRTRRISLRQASALRVSTRTVRLQFSCPALPNPRSGSISGGSVIPNSASRVRSTSKGRAGAFAPYGGVSHTSPKRTARSPREQRQLAGQSLARVQAGDIARPVEQARVRRDELVSFERGREDQAVGRIAVEIAQEAGADGDGAIHGYLDKVLP